MSKRVQCKFFAHGACLKGENCEFSHDWKAQPNNVCTFYQKGVCHYGSRCRYDHVKVSRHQASASSASSDSHSHVVSEFVGASNHPGFSSEALKPDFRSPTEISAKSTPRFAFDKPAWTQDSHPHVVSDFVGATNPPEFSNQSLKPDFNSSAEFSVMSTPLFDFDKPDWTQDFESQALPGTSNGHYSASTRLAEQPICSFAAAGSCPHGERCPHIHGDLCSICGKHCLHPYRPDEREEHIKLCQKNNERLEALRRSQEIECSVCLDRVLSKPIPAERKFGLLSECDHPFCISCIRNWRSNSPASGMDVNNALRACPICRKTSYFVIPSVIWYSTKEEKQDIIDSYKARLKSIDCKHFDFGSGSCPFGTSCFYRHTYKPHTNRFRASRPRPRTSRSRTYRQGQVVLEEEILMDLARQLVIEEEFDELEELQELMDDEDVDSLLEMAFLLMQLGSDDSSGDENSFQ